MARAPPVTPLYNHRPITFPQNQLLSRINAKTKTKIPYKISAVHVTEMPSQQHHHEAQAHRTLEIIGGAMESVLPALNSTLTRIPYNPFPLIGWNCHVETVYAAYFRSLPDVKLRRECIRTKDNGTVALDWVSGDDRHLPPDSPLLILLPGLAGGSENTYVRHMLVRARTKGWRVVVFNNRGCSNSPVTTPQLFSASFTGDMREVVAHVATSYPKANLYAVGWSMGANILVRYLGEESHTCPLSGAVSLCNPFNLVNSGEDFRYGFYDKALASSLRKIFKKHALLFEDMGGEFNIQLAANAKYVRYFDDALTRVSFGFKSVDDYYSNSNSSDSVKHVGIPLLCIQAANDPVAPARGIPREDIKENPNCLLIVTPKGGHLGWVAGDEAPCGAPWTDPVVMDYLQHLERVAGLASHSNSVDAQQSTEGLHSVEV
ncbi:embryogenesis-associated protein EMB8-like [Quercus robur]|uniref:embryogenesis-associated protein EMB8-like n=1 Tax=Quercus robur TaxID=38942 RepID=UPI002161D0CE|nr:embryogenesis-associated protein EMB8-like [Quercus robur]